MKWTSKKFFGAVGVIVLIVLSVVGINMQPDVLANLLEAIRIILETLVQ